MRPPIPKLDPLLEKAGTDLISYLEDVQQNRRVSGPLRSVDVLLKGLELNDFQQRVKDALWTYVHGQSVYDANERLVFAISAAETLFEREGAQPVRSRVAERMAFLIAASSEERNEILQVYAKAHQLRSKLLHHRVRASDETILASFYEYMLRSLSQALTGIKSVPSHRSFIAYLEERKLK